MDPPKAENISRVAELTLDTNTTILKLKSFVSRVNSQTSLTFFRMSRTMIYAYFSLRKSSAHLRRKENGSTR
jgi:hypothetical protein